MLNFQSRKKFDVRIARQCHKRKPSVIHLAVGKEDETIRKRSDFLISKCKCKNNIKVILKPEKNLSYLNGQFYI